MKKLFLNLFLIDLVVSIIFIKDTDLNETVAKFRDAEANFGDEFRDGDKGYLFVSDPLLACSDSIIPPFVTFPNRTDIKLVVLIKRGNCTFEQKVLAAQMSGYTGVIVYNNITAGIIRMSADSSQGKNIDIPSRMVSLNDGKILRLKYTFTKSRQNFLLVFYSNSNFNPQYYIIAFLGFISFGFFIIGVGFGIKLCRDAIKRRANRLRQCHLKKIPIKKFVKGQDPFETCAICLDDFKDGDKLRILPCNHAYHCICIDPWLLKQKRNCPICKCRIKIAGRDEDSDGADDVPSQNNTVQVTEATPLINPNINSPSYLSNIEPDIQFIPRDHNSPTSNCYENLSFRAGELQTEEGCDIKSNPSINNDIDREEKPISDLIKYV